MMMCMMVTGKEPLILRKILFLIQKLLRIKFGVWTSSLICFWRRKRKRKLNWSLIQRCYVIYLSNSVDLTGQITEEEKNSQVSLSPDRKSNLSKRKIKISKRKSNRTVSNSRIRVGKARNRHRAIPCQPPTLTTSFQDYKAVGKLPKLKMTPTSLLTSSIESSKHTPLRSSHKLNIFPKHKKNLPTRNFDSVVDGWKRHQSRPSQFLTLGIRQMFTQHLWVSSGMTSCTCRLEGRKYCLRTSFNRRQYKFRENSDSKRVDNLLERVSMRTKALKSKHLNSSHT